MTESTSADGEWRLDGLRPLVERPEIVGADLADVADAILVVERQDPGRP